MIEIRAVEKHFTFRAVKHYSKCHDFVIDALPRHAFLLLQVKNELLQVERSINYMLYDYRTVEINENLLFVSFETNQILLLIHSEECVAIETSLEIVGFIVQQKLKFDHINSAKNPIFLVFNRFELFECNHADHLLQKSVGDASKVQGQLKNLIHMVNEEF
jgi:hypothetical protein